MAAHPSQLSAGCPTLKPRYASPEAARRAALTAGRRSRIELSFYLCDQCSGYHLTRSIGGKNPRIR